MNENIAQEILHELFSSLAGCGKTRVRLEMLSSVGDLCD
jgi:hypothetical protein